MKRLSVSRVACGSALGVLLATPVLSQEGAEAPLPDSAFPAISQCIPGQPAPTLPGLWSSTVLLTPFDGAELIVAEMIVNSDDPTMLIVTKGLESGATDAFLIVGDDTYRIADGKYVPIWKGDWAAPPAGIFSGQDCSCQGISTVNGVDAEAWRCSNGKIDALRAAHGATENSREYDWFWFTTASDPTDRLPLRFLFSRPINHQKFPVLGDAAMANLSGVSTSVSPERADVLSALVEAVEAGDAQAVSAAAGTLIASEPSIPGVDFAGCASFEPPTWPPTAYSSGALFDVDGEYMSMLIYYDYPNLREVSKIRFQSGAQNDTRLTADTTWEIFWPYHGAPVQCQGGLKNVGIWHPDWPSRDGCRCKATIAPNTTLNPTDDTVSAMSCFFGGDAFIQSWYSTAGRPHLFYETNAADLDLIDYYAWIPNAQIDPGVFDEPAQCMQGAPTIVSPFCADCHGGKIGPN